MPRPRRRRRIFNTPPAHRFGPYDQPAPDEVLLGYEGLEALRLADVEGLDQASAAESMGVSRQTFGRVLGEARRTVAAALTGGLIIRIQGGDYELAPESEPGQGHGMGRGRGGRGRHGRREQF